MKLNRLPNRTLHRILWSWIAKKPGRTKYGWPGWKFFNPTPLHHCFACREAVNRNNGSINEFCRRCPLKWPDTEGFFDYMCLHSYYGIFETEDPDEFSPKQFQLAADLIRNLPWR